MKKQVFKFLAAIGVVVGVATAPAFGAGGAAKPLHDIDWSWEGFDGSFDQAQLQRGFQVYKEVCASCHGLNLLAYRNLTDDGGPKFTKEEAKAIAKEAAVPAGPDEYGEILDEDGMLRTRPGELADRFVTPFPNNEAAISAYGTVPPDLSVMAKARADGANYIYSLLVGYEEAADEEHHVDDGLSYNPYFPGGQLAMSQPLMDDMVEYADGTPATLDQTAKDVSAFLMWAAEPKLEERKEQGLRAMIFLISLAFLCYLAYRRVWAGIEH